MSDPATSNGVSTTIIFAECGGEFEPNRLNCWRPVCENNPYGYFAFIVFFSHAHAHAQIAGPTLDPGFLILSSSLNPATLQWYSKSLFSIGKLEGTNEIFDQNGQSVFKADFDGGYLDARYVGENFAVGGGKIISDSVTTIPQDQRFIESHFSVAVKLGEILSAGVGFRLTDSPFIPVTTQRQTLGVSLRFFEELFVGLSVGNQIRRSAFSEITRNLYSYGFGYLTTSENFKFHAEIYKAELSPYDFPSGFTFGEENITTGIIEFNLNGFQFGVLARKFERIDKSSNSKDKEDRFNFQIGWVPDEGFAVTVRSEIGDRRSEFPGFSLTRDREFLFLTLAYIF